MQHPRSVLHKGQVEHISVECDDHVFILHFLIVGLNHRRLIIPVRGKVLFDVKRSVFEIEKSCQIYAVIGTAEAGRLYIHQDQPLRIAESLKGFYPGLFFPCAKQHLVFDDLHECLSRICV